MQTNQWNFLPHSASVVHREALQLASALKLEREGKLDYFVSADKVLCEVAALEGLAVINPDVS